MTESSGVLKGVGVAVTRGEEGRGPLSRELRERGAEVLDWGTVGFAPPEDLCPLFSALLGIGEYDWICFSSPRAVAAVVSRVPQPPAGVGMAAVGPSTADSLRNAGWPVDRVPQNGLGEALVEAFRTAGDAGDARILFPASAVARDVIPRGLSELGGKVDRVVAYRMIHLPLDAEACIASLEMGEVQVVTFASPSAMEGLRAGLGEEIFHRLAHSLPAAAIGPTTAQALRKAGWSRISVAEEHTMDGLVDAAQEAVTIKAPG